MAKKEKEAIIENIETEVGGFGSKRIALREVRNITGNQTIRLLKDLRIYLETLTTENLNSLMKSLDVRFKHISYPGVV